MSKQQILQQTVKASVFPENHVVSGHGIGATTIVILNIEMQPTTKHQKMTIYLVPKNAQAPKNV
jgi:hypothetical protein